MNRWSIRWGFAVNGQRTRVDGRKKLIPNFPPFQLFEITQKTANI